MSDTEILIVAGNDGDENGDGWTPSLSVDHDADRRELYVIVGEEAAGMAEGVPADVYAALRTRLNAAPGFSAEELHCLTCAMAGNFPDQFAPIRMDILRKLAKASRAALTLPRTNQPNATEETNDV